MNGKEIFIAVIGAVVVAVLVAIERRQYVRKALVRLRDKGLRPEDLKPKPKSWYRFRVGVITFAATIASYPVVRWAFPDDRHLRIDSLLDAAVFGGLALICSAFAGWEIGDTWHDHAAEAHRAAKAAETASRTDKENRVRQAFSPVRVAEVILCPLLDQAFVVVRSNDMGIAKMLAPSASAKVNCSVTPVTNDELSDRIDRAMIAFRHLDGLSEIQAENLVAQGLFTFYGLSQIDSATVAELCNVSSDEADSIIQEAAHRSQRGGDG